MLKPPALEGSGFYSLDTSERRGKLGQKATKCSVPQRRGHARGTQEPPGARAQGAEAGPVPPGECRTSGSVDSPTRTRFVAHLPDPAWGAFGFSGLGPGD